MLGKDIVEVWRKRFGIVTEDAHLVAMVDDELAAMIDDEVVAAQQRAMATAMRYDPLPQEDIDRIDRVTKFVPKN